MKEPKRLEDILDSIERSENSAYKYTDDQARQAIFNDLMGIILPILEHQPLTYERLESAIREYCEIK